MKLVVVNEDDKENSATIRTNSDDKEKENGALIRGNSDDKDKETSAMCTVA